MMIGMIFLGFTILYIDRANLSAAAPQIKEEFALSQTEMGLILSGFFWTYAIFQLISGWFVDRFGTRIGYTVAAGLWSVFTMMTSLARGFTSLLGMRLLLGVGEAPATPCNTKTVREWMPKSERGTATGIFDSGARVGSALSLPIVVSVIALAGWRESFLVTGLIGAVWAVAWWFFYRKPEEHPKITQEELDYIQAGREDTEESSGTKKIRWRDLLGYRVIWGVVLGNFCVSFINYWFVTWFPSYLVESRGFDLGSLGMWGSIPALVAIPTGWLGGIVADRLIRRGWGSTKTRKTLIIGGLAVASVIVLAPFAPNSVVAVALMSVTYGSMTFANASVWMLPGDLSPSSEYTGSISGLMACAGSVAGMSTSVVTGILLDISGGSFTGPLVASFLMIAVGIVAFGVVVKEVKPIEARTSRV